MGLNTGLGKGWKVTIHYELIILYQIGYSPREVIALFGYARGTAYRFHKIYREARKRAKDIIRDRNSVSPEGKHRVNNLGALTRKKRVSHREKPVYTDEEVDKIIEEIKKEQKEEKFEVLNCP